MFDRILDTPLHLKPRITVSTKFFQISPNAEYIRMKILQVRYYTSLHL